MSKYKIQKTDILKDGKVFAEGSEIELTQKEAEKLADFLIPVELKKEPKKEEPKKTATKTETKTPEPKTSETTPAKKEEAKK